MNPTVLKIEKNKTPAPRVGPKYPFAKLKVGENVFIPVSFSTVANVRVAAVDHAKKNGVTFTVKQEDDGSGCRVYRVAGEGGAK
jgi:hypothetical protein